MNRHQAPRAIPQYARPRRRNVMVIAAALLANGCGQRALEQGPSLPEAETTPRRYAASRAVSPIQIDGRLDEPAWRAASWSAPFVDIEGPGRPTPRQRTRMKIMWDDVNLYLACQLDEPHITATLRQRDEIVFRDNDFEVFIDPDDDARNYYEIEINALGTVFDLLLVRTYRERGPARHEWNLAGLRSAIHLQGTLNDASDLDRCWCVEMALPWASLAEHSRQACPPRPGDVWRMNFSRVEWRFDVVGGRYQKRPGLREDNWVWSPQGVIDMHMPERWGLVRFIR